MARIRIAKTKNRSSKNTPKIAFFHDDNLEKFLTTRDVNKRSKGNKKLVTLNEKQKKKSVYVTATRRGKTFKFHI